MKNLLKNRKKNLVYTKKEIDIEDIRIFWNSPSDSSSIYLPHVSEVEYGNDGINVSYYCMIKNKIVDKKYPGAKHMPVDGTKKKLVQEFVLGKLKESTLED